MRTKSLPLLVVFLIRVISSGGGPGGVIAALALSKSPNVEIDLYEAATAFGDIGLSLGMPWRPWRILRLLGLQGYLAALLPPDQIPKEDVTGRSIFLHGHVMC